MTEYTATLEYMLDRSLGNYNLLALNSQRAKSEFIKEFYTQMAAEEHKKIEALKWAIGELQGEKV